jgi:hypothetical protein
LEDEQGYVQANEAAAYSDAEIHTRLCEQGNLRSGKLDLMALAVLHSIKNSCLAKKPAITGGPDARHTTGR